MNMHRRFMLALVVALGLAGCAGVVDASYVGPLAAPADAAVLASGITEFMAARLSPATTTLALDPLASDQTSNALTPALTASLRKRGFATVEAGGAAPPGARHVRYWITPMGTGNLVRLTIDGGAIEGSRFFIRNSKGGLQAGGPFTVKTVEVTL